MKKKLSEFEEMAQSMFGKNIKSITNIVKQPQFQMVPFNKKDWKYTGKNYRKNK